MVSEESRQVNVNFLSCILEHTKLYESSTSFWQWSAFATIASVLRDNCYKEGSEIFPNIYVLLLADSADQRKGKPVQLCEKLVTAVNNTKVISGRASIQAILDELSRTETSARTGKIVKGGSAIFIAEELSAALVSDPAAVSILTDIYDYKINFGSYLRSSPKFKISRIVFSFMAASNSTLLKEVYESKAITGGLLGRTFLVVPNEFRPGNSLMRMPDITASYNEALDTLKRISELTGGFVFSEEAIDEYDAWYYPFRQSIKGKSDKAGIVGRIHTGVGKLAMILAANEVTLEVSRNHVEEAINFCIGLLPNYQAFIMTTGKSTIAEAGGIILQALLSAPEHKLTQRQLLRTYWSSFDAKLLEECMTTFQLGELVKMTVSKEGTSYQMTDKCLQALEKGIQ